MTSKNEFIRVKNYINGEWECDSGVECMPLYNPSTGLAIGEVPMSTVETSERAVDLAGEAYKSWRKTPLSKRMSFIFKIREEMEANFEELAVSIAVDQAKHIAEARGEVRRVIEIVEMACSIPALMQGECLDGIAANINGRVVKQSLGVFCGVAPFNFPALVFGWFIPWAIGSGNTFVYKPSTESPLFMQKMMQILHDMGLPKGVVNIVHGSRKIVEPWYTNKAVAGLCLVGSSATATAMAEAAGRNGKKAMLLGGAKNYLVAMEDAPIDVLVQNIIQSGFGSAGQRCLAASNIAVVSEIYDEVVEKLVAAASQLTVGDAMDSDVYMGPVISKAAQERILGYINEGDEGPAELVLDGRKLNLPEANKNGFFVGPTIFKDVKPCNVMVKEEIFGPVLSIVKIADLDDALRLIENTEFGNGACIFTQNAYYTERFIQEADVGMVGVNVGVCAPHPYMPFGGIKGSLVGNNKVQGKDGIDFFTQNKTATIRVVAPEGVAVEVGAKGDPSVRSCVAG